MRPLVAVVALIVAFASVLHGQRREDLRRLVGQTVSGTAVGVVDGDTVRNRLDGIGRVIRVRHFVPFSRYPRDVANNFVLAHPTCNRSKADMLAAKRHLERWLMRLTQHADDLADIAFQAGVVVDAAVCRSVASWGYSSAAASGARAWVSPNSFEPVDSTYADCFLA